MLFVSRGRLQNNDERVEYMEFHALDQFPMAEVPRLNWNLLPIRIVCLNDVNCCQHCHNSCDVDNLRIMHSWTDSEGTMGKQMIRERIGKSKKDNTRVITYLLPTPKVKSLGSIGGSSTIKRSGLNSDAFGYIFSSMDIDLRLM